MDSESEDLKGFEWGTDDDGDEGGSSMVPSAAKIVEPVREACSSRPKLVCHFMEMGFQEGLIMKAITENGKEDEGAILNSLLTYSAIGESSPSPKHSICNSSASSSDENLEGDDFFSEDSSGEEYCGEDVAPSGVLSALVEMGYTKEEASSAMERCGFGASISEIADSIHAARLSGSFNEEKVGGDMIYYSHKDKKMWRETINSSSGKKRRIAEVCHYRVRKKASLSEKVCHNKRNDRGKMDSFEECEESVNLPNPMVGFGLPDNSRSITKRNLPDSAVGPPYFYYENVALAPKGVWDEISRHLLDVEPEFVDSKYFCAAARKRGYIHNLPIQNRHPLLPRQPRTIGEALPLTKEWWPNWDHRTHLNCLQTCTGSARNTERIRSWLVNSAVPPPMEIQKKVITECRKWNLVWVGPNKAAPLEPDEIEFLLGFPKNHTRGGGISRTERFRSLGNSFQIDTIAYHLSVLKEKFPYGIKVLSLFSGIGGAEVALHRIGIPLKTVVSVEISEINRNIIQSWWEQTAQEGTLIHINDVRDVTVDRLESMINTFGGFDLIIGGSPCNNLAGSNRVARDGLKGEHSILFYEYARILEQVRNLMRISL